VQKLKNSFLKTAYWPDASSNKTPNSVSSEPAAGQTSKALVRAVKKDPILNKMLTAKVTFLENQILDVERINLSSRAFVKADKSKPGRKKKVLKGDQLGWRKKITGFGGVVISASDFDY